MSRLEPPDDLVQHTIKSFQVLADQLEVWRELTWRPGNNNCGQPLADIAAEGLIRRLRQTAGDLQGSGVLEEREIIRGLTVHWAALGQELLVLAHAGWRAAR